MTPIETASVYNELVSVIVRAVPWKLSDKDGLAFVKRIHHDDQVLEEPNRPITLEDVLRAMRGPNRGLGKYYIECITGRIIESQHVDHETSRDTDTGVFWHLGHDLAWHRDNAPETIRFLHSLVV